MNYSRQNWQHRKLHTLSVCLSAKGGSQLYAHTLSNGEFRRLVLLEAGDIKGIFRCKFNPWSNTP